VGVISKEEETGVGIVRGRRSIQVERGELTKDGILVQIKVAFA
jgi:hypothetical protein